MGPLRFGPIAAALLIAVACNDDSATDGGGGQGGVANDGGGGSNVGGQPEGGAGGAGGGGGEGAGWDARFDAFVEALNEDLAINDGYGVSAAVMEGGVVTFAYAFGSKDPDGNEPLTPSTLMQIGSTTKQMTTTAMLRKVEAGDITLDDTLEDALPLLEFERDPTWDDQILLRHLISHSTGLADLTAWDGASDDASLASDAYGVFATNEYLMNPSGAFWNYSNPNFVLAGLVTEVNDTRVWPDIMKQDVFTPLGMDRTFVRKADVVADGDYSLSYGYEVDDLDGTGAPGDVDMDGITDSAWLRPAGLAWTTPTQMMKWADFIMRGNEDVLSDDLREEITTEQVDTLYFEGNVHYGYGMFVERGYLAIDGTWYPARVWDHGGNTLTFSHWLYILPDQDFAVAICSSGYATDFSASVDAALTTLADLPEPDTAPEYVIDTAEFPRHVGTYDDPFNVGQMIITLVDDDLQVSMPDLEALGYDVSPDLLAISSDIFVLNVEGQQFDLTFVSETPGDPSQYIRNRAFVATRSQAFAPSRPKQLDRARVERALAEARRGAPLVPEITGL